VKVRGHRVEPGEVEAVVMAVGASRVDSAVVVVREDRLVAFVKPKVHSASMMCHRCIGCRANVCRTQSFGADSRPRGPDQDDDCRIATRCL
jgi:hypothetical protein